MIIGSTKWDVLKLHAMQILDFSLFPLHLKPSSKGCFAVCTTVNAGAYFSTKGWFFFEGGVVWCSSRGKGNRRRLRKMFLKNWTVQLSSEQGLQIQRGFSNYVKLPSYPTQTISLLEFWRHFIVGIAVNYANIERSFKSSNHQEFYKTSLGCTETTRI